MEPPQARQPADRGDARPPVPPPAGERSADSLCAAIRAAATERGVERVLVLTHRSPDPDALASLMGAAALVEGALGFEAQIATMGRIHRAENLAMVRELALHFDRYDQIDPARVCGAILVDSQPTFTHTVIPEGIDLVGIIDHHIPPEGSKPWTGLHRDVRIDVGATSSLVYEYLRDAGVTIDKRTATALFCGVRFDTADLSHNVAPLDEEAYFETFRRADRPMLARIQRPRVPADYFRELARSLRMARRYGPAVAAFLGPVKNPESVAEMADFFLRMEGCKWSFVGGAYEGRYHVSLRTQVGGAEAYGLLDRLLADEGSFGGHGRVAGGQVALGEEGEALTRLERRLRERVIGLIDPDGDLDEDERLGTALA
ncbi:DHH family phosphoesterase [Engelhardtia mirabilis]|uniref:Putative manganese-dependent inorganic pyrophosphatase n=1 Tax=Engelhardtia mirabilis TaxID=2528011 RepID=A0A518BH52_9BACT|nr:putative manganese-dependent inorganic pyrophosphatase [Planctomycetes bacterium Pla133]QDV00633.1 putative manganese-dependent inorganic pyrophosphatase [Planctomycetes bacterium Pla86]